MSFLQNWRCRESRSWDVIVSIYDELRKKELLKLKEQCKLAVERLRDVQQKDPRVSVFSWFYSDMSFRGDVNYNGLGEAPSYRIWEVGAIKDRWVYIYQQVDMEMWRKLPDAPYGWIDIDRYEVAASDHTMATHQNVGVYIGTVSDEDFENPEWSVDMIIELNDLLNQFYTPTDVARRLNQRAHS